MVLSTLSLRIYGGSLSTGFNTQALVSAGAAPEGFRPTPPTIVDEQRSWMITHAQAYTAYSLYHRSYPAADGKPGQMLLVLFLPPQLRLAEGKSPLALLDTLHDLFVVQAMADDRLPAEPIDSTAFQNLLRRYKLEERPTLLPIMTGSEPASFCADNITQIEALMRYSRYTELSNVGRLEVGLHCATTVQLPIKGKPQAQSTAKPTAQPVDQPTESEQTVSDKQADIKQEEKKQNTGRNAKNGADNNHRDNGRKYHIRFSDTTGGESLEKENSHVGVHDFGGNIRSTTHTYSGYRGCQPTCGQLDPSMVSERYHQNTDYHFHDLRYLWYCLRTFPQAHPTQKFQSIQHHLFYTHIPLVGHNGNCIHT